MTDLLPRLEEYAEARDWTIVGAVVDRYPATSPTADRSGWPRLLEMVLSRAITGVVTATADMCGPPNEREAFRTWMADHRAFIACACTVDRPKFEGPR
ncbi:hypothetical protein ACFVUW_15765 [Streptomyces xiamenensis]|uniref:hypothetical protein n=1 Tax=Streptomyces xiamenensis TaxID=408015 RepID=UPI0036ED1C38